MKKIIPGDINGKKVVLIGDGVFRECGVKKIYIPSSVQIISSNAIQLCDDLTDIYYEGSKTRLNNALYIRTFGFTGNAGCVIYDGCYDNYFDGSHPVTIHYYHYYRTEEFAEGMVILLCAVSALAAEIVFKFKKYVKTGVKHNEEV